MNTNTNAALAEDLQDTVSKALRRAWQLGQTYWQQADSEYTSQHRKADETRGKFDALVEETRAALSTATHPTAGFVMVPTEATEAMRAAAVKYANGMAVYKNVSAEVLRIEEGIYGEVYEAMLAAAPKAEPAPPDYADAYQGRGRT